MKPLFSLVFCVLLLATSDAYSSSRAVRKVDDLYRENCQSCHGAGFFKDSEVRWMHGGSADEIARSIAEGHPERGMPAFGESLSAVEIQGLVVFLREKEKQARKSASPPARSDRSGIVPSRHAAFRIETVVEAGLEMPWALAFLPDGRSLVTERPGRVRVFDAYWKTSTEPVQGTPPVLAKGQGGLLDVAVWTGGKEPWIYLALSDPAEDDSGKSMTKIARGKIRDNKWANEEVIFQAPLASYSGSGVHFGSRMVFDEDLLYFIVGERGDQMAVQDPQRPQGKIYRMRADGSIPPGNPFENDARAMPGLWSLGHRNPQGLAWSPRDRSLYATEHGPRGGDEFNRILPGANYGWPLVSFGMDYSGKPFTAFTEKEGMESPLHHWTPSIAACGLACMSGDAFAEWNGDFLAGGLRGELHRLRVRDGKVVESETLLSGFGRIRDVRCGPDGLVYLVLNDPGRIVRLVPAASDARN